MKQGDRLSEIENSQTLSKCNLRSQGKLDESTRLHQYFGIIPFEKTDAAFRKT